MGARLFASMLWAAGSVSMASVPRAAMAAPGPFSPISEFEGERGGAGAMWIGGDDLMIVVGSGQAVRAPRGERAVAHPIEFGRAVDAAGTRAVGGGLAVFVDEDGRALRYAQGGWETVQVPVLEGDRLVAVAVDAKGKAYCVGGSRALYVWHEQQWRTHPYPRDMQPLAAAASPGGRLFIVGQEGLAIRFADGKFEPVIAPGLSAETIEAPWHSAWYSTASEVLWVRAGEDRLVHIDVETRTAGEHYIPEYDTEASGEGSGFTVLDGDHSARGDRVVMAMGRSIYGYEEGRFTYLGNAPAAISDLALVGQDRQIYVAHELGLSQVSTVGENLQPDRPLTAEERKLLESNLRWRLRIARLRARRPLFWIPTVRAQPGIGIHPDDEDWSSFDLEVGAGVLLAPLPNKDKGPTLWLWPEVGYHFDNHPRRGGHSVDLGMALGFGTHVIAGFYRPAAAIGQQGEATGNFGFHHSISAQLLWGIAGVDIGHQIYPGPGEPLHGFHVGFSFNIVPWVWLAII